MMEAIRYFLRRMRAPAEPRVLDVQLRDDSFVAVADDGSSRVVEWLDVVRIFTYKVDCWAIDHIWIAFELRSGEPVYVPEDAARFMDLGTAMVARFPICF